MASNPLRGSADDSTRERFSHTATNRMTYMHAQIGSFGGLTGLLSFAGDPRLGRHGRPYEEGQA
jgi:hypothetical protein